MLRENFQGWTAAVLTGSPDLGLELGIRAFRTHTMWNGAIECRLLRLKIEGEGFRELRGKRGVAQITASLRDTPGARCSPTGWGRISNDCRAGRARKTSPATACTTPTCRSMPSQSILTGPLPDGSTWLYVQEYAAPDTVEEEGARRRRNEAFSVLTEVTGVAGERIRVRMRRQQKGSEQYEKLDDRSHFHIVEEGGLKLEVNFDDYLDTGLFLDHRLTRARLREAAGGKRFLNLFAYTCTASVYAAAGKAAATVSVDLSNTYLDWAQRNFQLNGFTSHGNSLVQADCREWLAEAAQRPRSLRPDLPRPAHVLELQAHGRGARHPPRSSRTDRCLHARAGSGRAARVLDERAEIQD